MKTISNFFPKFVGWNWRGNIFHHNLGKRIGQNLFQPVSIKRIWLNFVGMVDGGREYNKELLGGDVPLGNKKP